MAEEMIDVYDWQGRFTGVTKPKSQVRADGDVHASVHLVLTDGRGRVVEQFRGRKCGHMRLVWDPLVAAGHISAVPAGVPRPDLLQQAVDTVIREAQEEVGLQLPREWFFTERCRFIGITRVDTLANEGYDDRWPDRALVFNFVLRMPEFDPTQCKLEPGKVLEVRWRHVNDILRALNDVIQVPYAHRPPDSEWMLRQIVSTVRLMSAGY